MEKLKLTPRQNEIAFALMHGAVPKALAKSLGYSDTSPISQHIAQAVRANGLASRDQFFAHLGKAGAQVVDARLGRKSTVDLTVPEYLNLRRQGMTIKQIASYVGSTKGSLSYWIRGNSLQGSQKGSLVA